MEKRSHRQLRWRNHSSRNIGGHLRLLPWWPWWEVGTNEWQNWQQSNTITISTNGKVEEQIEIKTGLEHWTAAINARGKKIEHTTYQSEQVQLASTLPNLTFCAQRAPCEVVYDEFPQRPASEKRVTFLHYSVHNHYTQIFKRQGSAFRGSALNPTSSSRRG